MNSTVADLKKPILTILFFFLSLFLYTKLFGPISFFVNTVQTTKTNLFHVEGKGSQTAIPDTALLTFGISKTSSTVSVAQSETNTIMNKIVSDLKNLGIEEKNIKTTNYSLYPNYDYTNGRGVQNGYTVSQDVEVRIKPIDKANKAVDVATGGGATSVGGISFVLDDETKKKLEQKARVEAVKNAKQKAEELSRASGIALGRIVDVQENTPQTFVGPVPLAVGGEKNVQEQTNLNPGQNTVEITITLFYETH